MELNLDPPPWHFVATDLDAGDMTQLERLFEDLRARSLDTEEQLQQWLGDESELLARIDAEKPRRYVAMTRETDDDEKKEAYLELERNVMPRVKLLADALDKQFLASPSIDSLDPERYEVIIRRRRTQSAIFRPENTELQRRESELQANQQSIVGGITVEFEGRQHTLQQMAPYFESHDRGLRERAFRASLAERRQYWSELEELYDQLIAIRSQMGKNAGFDSYTPYRFLELGRFDYTSETCFDLHRAVEQCVVPALRTLDEQRIQRLGIDSLRPWDLEVGPAGHSPHRPFETQEQLQDICRRVFARIDTRFAGEFEALVERDLLDLMSRKGKAPGGYQYQLEDVRLPFIFANSVGLHHDVQTLLHESGHAFHSLLSRHHDLLALRDYPIEFAETASMSMELIGLENLGAVYEPGDAKSAYDKHLEGVLRILTWISSIDSFQHWVFDNPDSSRDERRSAWVQIRQRFAPTLDWSGFEDALAMQWIGQSHLFQHAFYYVEYAIAQIAALQIWRNYRNDNKAAITDYRHALSLGGSKPLPQLFQAANIDFDLSPAKLQQLVDDVVETLAT